MTCPIKFPIDYEKLECFVPPVCDVCGQPIWAGELVAKQDGIHLKCLKTETKLQ